MKKQTQSKATAGAVAGGVVGAMAVLLQAYGGLDIGDAAGLAAGLGVAISWGITYFAPRNVEVEV